MKKLALALSAFGALTLAAPAAFACGGHDSTKSKETKTAEKTDGEKSKDAPAKKAPAKKKDEAKKDGDKVSMK